MLIYKNVKIHEKYFQFSENAVTYVSVLVDFLYKFIIRESRSIITFHETLYIYEIIKKKKRRKNCQYAQFI